MTQRRMIALTVTLWVTITVGACSRPESDSSPLPSSSAESSSAESVPGDQSASIWVDPDSVAAGEAATLSWRTTNSTDVFIDGIGAVQTNGSVTVSPSESTIYHLTSNGAGGTLDVTTALTVRELSQSAGAVQVE